MESLAEYTERIDEILARKEEEIERELLPRIRDNFLVYHKSYQTVYNILVRKSLLQEDPYKYEQKISEITLPATGPMTESERSMQMSIRLSNFDSQLEFLNHYYQFSISYLNMQRIKSLAALATFIKWEKVGHTTTEDINTSLLSEMVRKVAPDTDTVSAGILGNSQAELVKTTKMILQDLKELTSFHRETYKQLIRRDIFPPLEITREQVTSQMDNLMKAIRRRFTSLYEDKPFYADLIQEALNESFSAQAEKLQNDLIQRLKPREVKKKTTKEVSFKATLMEAVRLLGAASTPLELSLNKLKNNFTLLESKKDSLGEKIRKWFAGIVSKDSNKRLMDLEVFEESSSLSTALQVDFTIFYVSAMQQSKKLQSLIGDISPVYQRLSSASDDRIYEFLANQVADLQKTAQILPAIMVYQREEASRDERGKLLPIEKEVDSIKNCIQSANRKRFQFASRKEELEQLKRLGMADS